METIVAHGTWQLAPADEDLHARGGELLWSESYYYDFAAPDGSIGGYVRLGLYPNWGRAWYWACLVRPGQPAVLLADNAVPLPPPGSTDLTARNLTARQEITAPLSVARVRVDATAALLPDAFAAYGDLTAAEPVRLVLDLEWRTAGGVYPYRDLPRYEIPCEVTGIIRAGNEEFVIAASGERDHSWGERDWWQISWLWSSGRLADGTAFHGMQANIGIPVGWPSFVVPPGGAVGHRSGFAAATSFGPGDTPRQSRLLVPDVPLTAEPLAFAPVAMTAPDGRTGHFPRALCRFTADDGRTGYGWTEWNQPPGWQQHRWSFPAAGRDAGDRA